MTSGPSTYEFLWGAATSSHQIEGGNRFNDWWEWEQKGNIEGKVISGQAADHWNRFREDLQLAAELGLNSYRFSLEWSRLEPSEGVWDRQAMDWYRTLVDECARQKLVPMATLHHFTIPQWLAARGGFAAEDAPEAFARFAEKVASVLGPDVPYWCTINEPMSLVVGGYLAGYMPPAVRDPRVASKVCRNLFAAHVRAYDILHSGIKERRGPWKELPLMVGFAHNMIDFVPLRNWHPIERLTARVFRRFYNRSWPDAVTGDKQHFGVSGLFPYPKQVMEGRGRKTADFIGVNYYTRVYVRCAPYFLCPGSSDDPGVSASSNMPVGISFSLPKDTVSDLGWVIHPAGLGRMLRFLKRYELPLFITENGIADAEDKLRPKYLLAHLSEVARAVEDGADVRGYFHWSLIDNFEWIKGFSPRFGLFEVDYDSFARRPRGSAELYRQIIEAHGGERPRSETLAVVAKERSD